MSQQITITIPDALAERLKAVKQNFNVSGVCQDALEREVTKQEYLMLEPKDMEKIMKRLRAEKQEFIKQMRDMGREHGLEAAKEMDYADLRAAEEIAESQGDVADNIVSASLWTNWLEDSVKETEGSCRETGEAFDREPYLEGWIEGVMEFWNKIKDKL